MGGPFSFRSREENLGLCDCEWRPTAVQDSVAVRANGSEIANRVDSVGLADRAQGNQMMHVYQIGRDWTVPLGQEFSANGATRSITGDASGASCRVALECVHVHANHGSFGILGTLLNLLPSLAARFLRKLVLRRPRQVDA